MRVTIASFAFLCGLLVGTRALRASIAALPSPTAGALEHLAKFGDDYDVIVVGSSLSKVNFMPTVFDEHMAELGHPVRSFSFGMKGMRGAELHYYVERVLQLPLRRLKWLIVDVSLKQDMLLDPDGGYTERAIAWHAPTQAWLGVEQVLASSEPLLHKLKVIAAHARHLLLNRGNVGKGLEALADGTWFSLPHRVMSRGALVARFIPGGQREKVDRYLRGRARHEAQRRALKWSRRRNTTLHPGFIQRAIADLAHARGKPVAFLLSAMLIDSRFDARVPGAKPLNVIDLDDPSRYPELYEPEMRYDELHLTSAGSVPYTRAIADQLVELMAPAASQARR
jgi:hypothetical protein